MTSTFRSARRALLALSGLLLLALSAPAQRGSQAEMRAYLSSGVVRLGDRVQLIVSVENARSSELRALPQVPGLALGPVPVPAEHRSLSIIGNRRQESVSRTWTIPLRPSDVGVYRLPPFEVVVDGEARATPELVLNVVRDMKGEELGFLEMRASSDTLVVGQPFTIELVFGFDAAIADATNYGNLALSWWGNLPGVLENEPPALAPGRRRVQISVNDRESVEVEQLDSRKLRGRDFVALRLARSFTPTRTGRLEVPNSYFEFGRVVESRDFFRTRREKGETYFSRAPDLAIEVIPLPEAGRPLDFSGAIGQLVASADATPRDVDAGESIKFKVEWSGPGNLEFFSAPDPARLESFRDFRVYGKTEEKSLERRTVVYDLAPVTSQAKEIPALPLSVYDPVQRRYVTLSTEPLPIRVRALEGAGALPPEDDAERFRSDVRDVARVLGRRDEQRPLGAGLVLAVLAVLPAAWFAARTAVRRYGAPDAPAARARRQARRALAKRLGGNPDARAQLDALLAFLAARTARTAESWIGERLGARAPEFDAVVGELEQAVWGGRGGALPRERVLQAADAVLRGGL